jgi:hypothetical protein
VANGCYVVPTGWTLVGFQGSQSPDCPSGYTQTNLVENPNVPASACTCECTLSQAPSCPSGPIPAYYDQDNSKTCGTMGTPGSWAYSTSCDTNMGDMYHPCALVCPTYPQLDLKFVPPAATGGSCQKSAAQQPQNVTATSEIACAPDTPPCTGNQCTPSFPSPLQVCIVQSGKQACPTTTFTQAHDVGTGVTYACDSTTCGCTTSAQCTGLIKLFTSGSCTGTEIDIPADGACHPTGAKQNDYAAYLYAPNVPANAACTNSGTPSVQSVGLTNEETICCAP